VAKEYVVNVRGAVGAEEAERLRRGVVLDDGPTAPAVVEIMGQERTPRGIVTSLSVVLREGRKRQVRRMMEAVGHRVVTLHRSRFAGLSDAVLAPGQARRLSPAEVEALWRAAGRR
jgi:pseudouridine synthase